LKRKNLKRKIVAKIIEAKRSEKFEAKGSEKKRKIYFLVSRNKAKIKRNVMLFRYFRFEAKIKNKRKWDTLGGPEHTVPPSPPPHPLT